MLTPKAVLQAAEQIRDSANHTPVLTSRSIDAQTGHHLFFKCENFQRVGAFKFRGAFNALSRLSEQEKQAGVITHSSGNHAQGVALAAKLLGIRVVVVMPVDAPPNKRNATLSYGAEIIPCDALERESVTQGLITRNGYTLIHPYDNDDIIAGQGTAALELFTEVDNLDYLFVPVGGGGLISGCALAAVLKAPGCKVIGVEPELGADANRSWRLGQIEKLDVVPATVADGLRTRSIGVRNFEIMRHYVSDMTAVSEIAIIEALEMIWSRLKIIVEPSAAVALAPLLAGTYPLSRGKRIGIMLSGGNVNVAACGFLQRPGFIEPKTPSVIASPTKPDAIENAEPPKRTASRILVTTPIAPEAREQLLAVGQVDDLPNPDEEQLTTVIGNYQALIVGPRQTINSHVIKHGFNLRVIGSLEPRLDAIDVSAARAQGIEVVAAPNTRAVTIAEQTISRLLALSDRFGGSQLAQKTLGIIGFGLVGRLVAQRAAAFDMRILTNQPRLTPELALATDVEETDLVDLLRRSDFISLHVPYREETEAIIGPSEIALMKPSVLLVNMGHTDLIDETALLAGLRAGRPSAAAIPDFPPSTKSPSSVAVELRRHPHVLVSPHVSSVLEDHYRDVSLRVVEEVIGVLKKRRTSDTLNLQIVPVEQIVPHEHIDDKRVNRLMERLEVDGRLVNPPVTTFWKNYYVILDGATRYSSLERLGYPYAIVQVVDPEVSDYQLHTWYHVISAEEATEQQAVFDDLVEVIRRIDGLLLNEVAADVTRDVLTNPETICYFMNRNGNHLLATLKPGASKLSVMNALVDTYNHWGNVERTLLTDVERLISQFPRMVAVAVYPQFQPKDVFDAAARGEFLPAGLTRFVIPGRILRLNADLSRLKRDEPLADKKAWFDEFLTGKLSRSRLRYYQEPVVLLDE